MFVWYVRLFLYVWCVFAFLWHKNKRREKKRNEITSIWLLLFPHRIRNGEKIETTFLPRLRFVQNIVRCLHELSPNIHRPQMTMRARNRTKGLDALIAMQIFPNDFYLHSASHPAAKQPCRHLFRQLSISINILCAVVRQRSHWKERESRNKNEEEEKHFEKPKTSSKCRMVLIFSCSFLDFGNQKVTLKLYNSSARCCGRSTLWCAFNVRFIAGLECCFSPRPFSIRFFFSRCCSSTRIQQE